MTRSLGLVVVGIAMVLLYLAMAPAENRMQEDGPGMVPFELNGGQHHADEILAEWGDEGQDAAREQLWIDFGFMAAYGTFLTLALGGVRDMARNRSWRRLAAIGGAIAWFGAGAACFDALENVCLLLTLGGHGAAFPLLATIFSTCKFTLMIVAIAYLVAGLSMRAVSLLRPAKA